MTLFTRNARSLMHKGNGFRWMLCLLLVTFLPCRASSATVPVDIAQVHTLFSLEAYTGYLEDPEHRLQPLELLSGRHDNLFSYNASQSFNFGISQSTYWLAFELTNGNTSDSPVPMRRLLEINYPPLDHLSLYFLDSDGQLVVQETGDALPFSSRALTHNAYLFPIVLQPEESRRYLIKVDSEGSIRVPLSLWEPESFSIHMRSFLLLYGIYLGIISLMFFYNLLLFVFIRDTSYLHYIFYIGALIFFQANYSGIAFQYLWPQHPQLNNTNLIISIFLIVFFSAQFTRRVLDTRATLPRVDKLLVAIAIFALILVPLGTLLPYHLMLNLGIVMAFSSVATIVVGGTINSYRGYRTARFFLLAWFSFLIGAVILAGLAAGIFPANFFTNNALILGSAIEVTLLSLSLADRMHTIERKKTQAEQQARQALQAVNRTLLESNKIKDEFLNTISHEMRTPMHGVISSIHHMHTEQEADRRELFIDSADRSAQQMMMLIDSVLNYTELHSATFKLEIAPFTLERLIDSLDDLFRNQAQGKGLKFTIEVDESIPHLVIGDFRRTQQVLINLLSNAVKFTHNGFVKLSVDLAMIDHRVFRSRIVFRVSDSGIGILPGMEPVIFDRLRQLEGSFSRGFGGLGIGLATSREICRLMGAELKYQSEPQQGSTFTFSVELPFSPRNPVHQKTESDHYSWEAIAQQRNALIVEDNTVNQLVLKATLIKLGIQTLTASNGSEALDVLLQNPVDIVLMDCQMPVMDGFEASRAIRQLASQKSLVPIIAITANAMSKDRERCIEAGMNDYMSKPVNIYELKEKLLKWLPIKPQEAEVETETNTILPLHNRRDCTP